MNYQLRGKEESEYNYYIWYNLVRPRRNVDGA
jgi:hypothetical protein